MPAARRATIRPAERADAVRVADIYNHYVAHTVVTFEEEAVAAGEMAQRIEEVRGASLPWLVAEEDGRVVGYAYAARWRARSAYRFSFEVTVYLGPDDGGRGIGSRLYGEVFPLLQAQGLHAVMAVIALPNEASVALHEKFGLRKVGHLQEVGFKFGRWVDVGYWQRTL